METNSIITRTVCHKIVPFIIIFGLYIVIHGPFSPGGGFQGGVIIGCAYILYALAYDMEEGRKGLPEDVVKVIESLGVILYVIVGLTGILFGYNFLSNKVMNFIPVGSTEVLLSSGALLWINIAIGMHVACTIIGFFYLFLEVEDHKETAEVLTHDEGH
jgi:multicomponent Na+:H+ antiporter subunit B